MLCTIFKFPLYYYTHMRIITNIQKSGAKLLKKIDIRKKKRSLLRFLTIRDTLSRKNRLFNGEL